MRTLPSGAYEWTTVRASLAPVAYADDDWREAVRSRALCSASGSTRRTRKKGDEQMDDGDWIKTQRIERLLRAIWLINLAQESGAAVIGFDENGMLQVTFAVK